MKNISTIAGKELRGYLNSPIAYIIFSVFLVITGWYFGSYLRQINYDDTTIQGFLIVSVPCVLAFAAVITMRSLSEEKKMGTWELLLTSPVSDTEVVLGKFLACFGLLLVLLLLTLFYTLLLFILGGAPDTGPIWASYLGLVMVGSSALAIGIFVSSLTNNQIISVVVSGGILAALWGIGFAVTYVPKGFQQLLSYISYKSNFNTFDIGIIDTRTIVFFLSLTVLFLYLAVRSLETGRWN
ncbi:MAG: ABC transporter permease [Dehalococcoidales bacterium]|jgi:ABC-2 type transport system permease protein